MLVKEATLKYHYFEWNLEFDRKQDVSFAGSCITVANFIIHRHQHVIKRLYIGLSLCFYINSMCQARGKSFINSVTLKGWIPDLVLVGQKHCADAEGGLSRVQRLWMQ